MYVGGAGPWVGNALIAAAAAAIGYVAPYYGFNPILRLDFLLTVLAFFFALVAIVLYENRSWLVMAGSAAVLCLTVAIFADSIFGFMPVPRFDTACAAVAGVFLALSVLGYFEKT